MKNASHDEPVRVAVVCVTARKWREREGLLLLLLLLLLLHSCIILFVDGCWLLTLRTLRMLAGWD